VRPASGESREHVRPSSGNDDRRVFGYSGYCRYSEQYDSETDSLDGVVKESPGVYSPSLRESTNVG